MLSHSLQSIKANMFNVNDAEFDDLNESERKIVDAISYRMNMLRDDLLKMLREKEHIQKLDNDVLTLKATVSRLQDKIDENDSYERRDTLLLS